MQQQNDSHTEAEDAVPAWLTERLQASTISTFDKIIGETICLHPNELSNEAHYDGVIGIISFVGEFTWSMALGIPHRSAEAVANKFAGFEIPFDSADMADVIGELTNVLAGVICGELENINVKTNMSLPTVARGKDFQMSLPETLISQRLHFKTVGNDFWVKQIVSKNASNIPQP